MRGTPSTTTRRRPSARAALAAAQVLVQRAVERAGTCGGKPHEYVTERHFEELRHSLPKDKP
jgi:hypothetical protein